MKKLSNIFYPIEFNDHDKEAIKTVAKFAKDMGASLEVMHVVANNFPPYQMAEPSKGLTDAALDYLSEFIRKNVGSNQGIKTKVVSGQVNQEILNYIDESKPDLVAMASKESGEEGTNHLGGTAYRILSSSGVPVLTMTGAPADLRPKKILVPVDVYFGIYDLKRILHEYFREGAPEIELLIIVDPTDDDDEQAQEKRILKYELGKFMELGFTKIHGKTMEHKNPAEAISYYANTHDFDMIVMTTHGRQGLSRFFLGSTTAQVIHNSKVPVFTIKGKNHGKGKSFYAENLPI